jgi:hypothetical protein
MDDGIFASDGVLTDEGRIEDCSSIKIIENKDIIEQAIADGKSIVEIDGNQYTWII